MPDRVLLRNSERSAFKTCRFRWALTYGGVFEVGPVRSREPAKALWFGDLIHRGLADYYPPGVKRGTHPAKTFIKLYDADERLSAVLRDDEGEWVSMRDLGKGMLEAYVEEYKARDEEWEVIASERTFRLPVKVPELMIPLGPRAGFILVPEFRLIIVGTMDGLWRHRVDRDRIVFKEFKTAASISLDALGMDDQAGYYWTYGPKWLWRQNLLAEKTYPTEILYTFLRKAIRNPDKTYDAQGRVLNLPTKEALEKEYARLKRPLPEGSGAKGAVKVEDMISDLPGALLLGEPSKSQPPRFFEREPVYRDQADRANLHQRVLAEARDMWLIRHGVGVAYKNPGPLHMPNCRGCPVRDACELHETGHDWRAMLDGSTQPWDPYAAHEVIERR